MNLRKLALLMCCIALGCALSAFAEDTPATTASPAALPAVDHMVYLSFLPETSELVKDAATNGLTVLRLDRTADKVVVSYKYPDGHTATLGYALLSAAGQADRTARQDSEIRALRMEQVDARPYTVVRSEPEVVYVERPYRTRVVYRDSDWDDFWPPLVLGLGIGYISGHNSGHYHGGYRGGYGHGGWHH